MKLKVLGTGSKGNSYILTSSDYYSIIIDAGVSYRKIQKHFNFDLDYVSGCIITHEHGDHVKSCKKLAENGIECYMSVGTREMLGNHWNYIPILKKKHLSGGFIVKPFKVRHDCKDPYGYIIYHKEMGSMVYITDSGYISYKLNGMKFWLVECNYSVDLLDKTVKDGKLPWFVANRIRSNHMSIDSLKMIIDNSDLSNTEEIMLIHLSDTNSNADEFRSEIEDYSGVKTSIATNGIEINIKNS